jgi:glucose-1-phosphate thymidylyltransferase
VNSVIRGPAIIGDNCVLIDCYVGPFTAIDDNCSLHKTELENSIILQDCTLDEVGPRIESSLLGRGATVRRNHSLPRSMSLVMGDSSSVVLP